MTVSPSVLGAAAGVGLALLVGLTLVIYRYYRHNRNSKELFFSAPPIGTSSYERRSRLLVLNNRTALDSHCSQQNFRIFREQPQHSHAASAFTASASAVTKTNSTRSATHMASDSTSDIKDVDDMHARLSLPYVHASEEKVSPSRSSYSLPIFRRRSPVVSRTPSVDTRAAHVPRLSISDRSDSQQSTTSIEPWTPISIHPHCTSPVTLSPDPTLWSHSPTHSGRPRSMSPVSPLLSPAYFHGAESTNNTGSISSIGAIQPDLYKKKDIVFLPSSNSQRKDKCGRLHFRLKYDFNRSDLVVHVIEAVDISAISENGFNDPYVKVALVPEVDTKTRQTEIQRNTTNPIFDEVFKFPVSFEDLSEKTLLLQVFDYDRFSRNDITGDVRVKMCDLDVTTEVEVWSEISKTDKISSDRPEILLSLSYLPSAGRLTVVVLKASNLMDPCSKEFPDSYVKVTFMNGERKKKKKTATKRATNNPVWNEALSFDVSEGLKHCRLVVNVINCHHGNIIPLGTCILGVNERGREVMHWQDVLRNPRKAIAMWHGLHV